MSGLEVVGIVAANVSAFTGASKLLQKWREKKRERKEREENEVLESAVTAGGHDVQHEYCTTLISRGWDEELRQGTVRCNLSSLLYWC